MSGQVHFAERIPLIGTCKLLGIEPLAYLRDVLDRIPTHPADRIAELTPRNWKALPKAS
jgi:transposase